MGDKHAETSKEKDTKPPHSQNDQNPCGPRRAERNITHQTTARSTPNICTDRVLGRATLILRKPIQGAQNTSPDKKKNEKTPHGRTDNRESEATAVANACALRICAAGCFFRVSPVGLVILLRRRGNLEIKTQHAGRFFSLYPNLSYGAFFLSAL